MRRGFAGRGGAELCLALAERRERKKASVVVVVVVGPSFFFSPPPPAQKIPPPPPTPPPPFSNVPVLYTAGNHESSTTPTLAEASFPGVDDGGECAQAYDRLLLQPKPSGAQFYW